MDRAHAVVGVLLFLVHQTSEHPAPPGYELMPARATGSRYCRLAATTPSNDCHRAGRLQLIAGVEQGVSKI